MAYLSCLAALVLGKRQSKVLQDVNSIPRDVVSSNPKEFRKNRDMIDRASSSHVLTIHNALQAFAVGCAVGVVFGVLKWLRKDDDEENDDADGSNSAGNGDECLKSEDSTEYDHDAMDAHIGLDYDSDGTFEDLDETQR